MALHQSHILNLQNWITRNKEWFIIMCAIAIHKRTLSRCWLNRNLDARTCIKASRFYTSDSPIELQMLFSLARHSFVLLFFIPRRHFGAPTYANDLAFSRDRSMEQSASNVIMNFDGTTRSRTLLVICCMYVCIYAHIWDKVSKRSTSFSDNFVKVSEKLAIKKKQIFSVKKSKA